MDTAQGSPGSTEAHPEGGAEYRGYRLVPVYRDVTAAQRAEAIRFWFEQGAINESCVAERRSHELVYLARASNGKLAGVTSVSLGRRNPDGRTVYDLRIFIAPDHRTPCLARELVERTRTLLKADSLRHPASGVRLSADNPKLMRPGMRRYLERHGFAYRGTDRRGIDRWFWSFD
ncbi:MAG: hypothetical protein ACM3ST_05485 [Bdellovibrio bacteriovorus]